MSTYFIHFVNCFFEGKWPAFLQENEKKLQKIQHSECFKIICAHTREKSQIIKKIFFKTIDKLPFLY